ncbi:DinB/UmuC family translesion DNA polymerase [Fusibacter tunisiensis]|uniref:Nucleotidyltransferase/DNA polymerase involved in DNA repair n=1 Tax=Fusibacter tunisiensis TaxID=1008308 RepID=A0ABS2MQR5_9FIRM|nr:hypothetical protein [Fusibacter tunisiensis]MBM7561756.1 nucleotidyltransferase/DNA polymerase involved in DNA repair [Fusibacter tunisiensis]
MALSEPLRVLSLFKDASLKTWSLSKASHNFVFSAIVSSTSFLLALMSSTSRFFKIALFSAYNKFLAKLASDWNKPDGIFEIKKSDIPELLKPLPIIKIHGLGKKTAERLNRIGIFTIEDLYNYPQDLLQTILGERDVYDRIHGIDLRPIVRNYERKSYGKETTLDVDIDDQHEITTYLLDYLDKIYEVMKGKKWLCKTLVVKIKYTDFEQITRSHSFDNYTNHYETLKEGLYLLIDQIDFYKPVRLVGLTISNLESDHFRQFSLLDSD